MTMRSKAILAAAAGAAALVAPAASAASFIVDSTTNTPLAGSTYTTFDNRTLGGTTQTTPTGVTVAFTGNGAFVQGSVPFRYSAPIATAANGAPFGMGAGNDATTYVSTGIGSATMTFSSPVMVFGLLWGSIDRYNSLTINTADGMSRVFTVADVGNLDLSRYVNFYSSSAITSVVASSTDYSFEFDNVSTSVPEPATWAMMLAGFGAVGFAMRRRQRGVRAAIAA